MGRIFFTLLLILSLPVHAGEATWEKPLNDESSWSGLTFAGTLLAASKTRLAHVDRDGELLWVRDDLAKLAQFNVNDVPGTPFLIVTEKLGNIPPKSRLQVLNLSTGETLWDTGEQAGSGLGAYPVPARDLLVYVADVQTPKAGTYAIGLSLETGEEKWRTKLGSIGTLPTHPSDIGGFIPSPDLNGHPPPVVTDDTFILVAGNLYALNIADGTEKWRFKLKASVPSLKNNYAQPLLAGETLYAVSTDSLYAIDAQTGEEKWKTKIKKASMPQLELVGDKLVGRLGGTFSNGKDLVQHKPFGAFVVDVATGELAWKWTKAKGSITNLLVKEDKGLVMLADKNKLYALDLNAQKKPAVVQEEKLEFKRKMGTADVAAKGLGAAGGFLSGGIAGGIKGSLGGGDRSDPPLDIAVVGDRLVVRAQYHVLAHNLTTQEPEWSIEFAPPGMNSFALIAMGAVTASLAVANAAGAWGSSSASMSSAYADSTLNITNAFQEAVAERYAAAEKSREVAFFLTKEEDEMVLLGIDLASGGEVGRVPMSEKEPQFMVDSIGSRVYYFRDKKTLVAYDF